MQADCPVALSPLDENRRLAALRALEILDSEPETDFDALTRLAAHALGTPIAVIGLMDSDRLWFKSRVGLAAPELDRQIAFCSHTITQPGRPLIVPDLLADARFTDNPWWPPALACAFTLAHRWWTPPARCWAPWRCSTPSRASSPRRNKRHCWTAPPW